jgi:hypothetical protein
MNGGVMQWDDILKIVGPAVLVGVGAVLWIIKIVSDERKERIASIGIERERRVLMADEFATFREKIAREVVTITMLDKFEERIMDGFNRLGDRMDRLIEGRPPQGAPPPR